MTLRIITCPMGHKIIVADNFPFEYNGIKCNACKKIYRITPFGRIKREKGKFVSRDI